MSSLVGNPAPNVILDAVLAGKGSTRIDLTDYRGKWVVLFFFPAAFSGVCGSEVEAFQENYSKFSTLNAELIGGSVDSSGAHLAWMKHEVGELSYPLFSDQTGVVSRAFGVLREERGTSKRAAFILDPEGTVVWQVVHENRIGRNTDEILRVLKALQSGEACPVNWGV